MSEKNVTMELYDKGLLSRRTLCLHMGFDYENEIGRKKMEMEQMKELGLDAYTTQSIHPKDTTKRDKFDQKCQKIEAARRNIEALTKVYNSSDDYTDGGKRVMEEILSQMQILKEVKDL